VSVYKKQNDIAVQFRANLKEAVSQRLLYARAIGDLSGIGLHSDSLRTQVAAYAALLDVIVRR
jgi:hypothetical protein